MDEKARQINCITWTGGRALLSPYASAANETVARHYELMPPLYRIHENPGQRKPTIAEFITAFELRL